MSKYDLSIIIPSRNEMFLAKTIEDILEKKRGKTQVIAVLDGDWAEPQIADNPDVIIIHNSVSVGQRAATNQGARVSEAKYVAKCDAHCGFDEGFDVKLMAKMKDDWTVVPVMRNLHAFDWVCENGHRRYQGTSAACGICGAKEHREMIWIGKTNPQSDSYCFDPTPHFQYFKEYRKRDEYKKMLTETGLTESMSLQGSFFMLTRDKYFELNICDENFGSWGSQGIEVAVKTWLSGGRVLCNHDTWYGHMFRTQGGDFAFPYPQSERKIQEAKAYARDLFFDNKYNKAIHPLSWLLKKFWPIPMWTDEDLKKFI